MEVQKFFAIVLMMVFLTLQPMIADGNEEPISGWGANIAISSPVQGNADDPSIAIGPDGEAICVWSQYDEVRRNIWANRFIPRHGWDRPELIEQNNAGNANYPSVALTESGNAMAVWVQNDGTYYRIYANRYQKGIGWLDAIYIDQNTGDASFPRLAMDPLGNAIAVWSQHDGVRFNIWANRYATGTGWGTAVLLENMNSGGAVNPDVAMDRYGNALAVWTQSTGSRSDIYYSWYTTGASWQYPELVEQDDIANSDHCRVAMTPYGTAVVVWLREYGVWDLWTNTYSRSGGWGTAELLETDGAGNVMNPVVSMNSQMETLVTWSQSDGTTFNIWANVFRSGTGWESAEMIEPAGDTDAYIVAGCMDGSGNAMVVWYQFIKYNLCFLSNRNTKDSGWSQPEAVDVGEGTGGDPALASDSDGNVHLVFKKNNGKYNEIRSNIYIPKDDEPPMLAVSFPQNGLRTTSSATLCSGMTEPGSTIVVNDLVIYGDDYGAFDTLVPLLPGNNTITVTAIDESGNSVSIIRTVHYDDPVSQLVNRVLGVEANCSSLQTSLSFMDDLAARLEENSTRLDDAISELEKLRQNISVLFIQLDIMEAELAALRAQNGTTDLLVLNATLSLINSTISNLRKKVEDLERTADEQEERINDLKGAGNVPDADDDDTIGDLAVFILLGFCLLCLFVLFLLIILLFVRTRSKPSHEE